MIVSRLRSAGFEIRLAPDGRIGLTPADRLTVAQVEWIRSNRDGLVAELKNEAAANDAQADIQHCAGCAHDTRSLVNPAGGLTHCRVRQDVPMMVPGTRLAKCSRFEALE